ncbi:hypothetical protein ACFZBU_12265 [Embleya sp. NPDC008237]|uniref:hypothetical protein n=1 Tax=Embleya sp. NPDC008237 TaxID=3363978 RepID=UPI0036EFC3F1
MSTTGARAHSVATPRLGYISVGDSSGLTGGAGLCANTHGINNRPQPDPVNLVCMLGVLASAAVLAVGSRGGAVGLAALVLGTLVLDIAMQSGMVANQARVFALRPDARSRLNTA